MRVVTTFSSPNFASLQIAVDFVILHYTACDLKRTLSLFADPEKKVCAHFVLDTDGTVYDLGNFFNGPIRRGAHAGESRLQLGDETFTALNNNSIGIELVNLNGNLQPYSEAQYVALNELLKHLIKRFPTTAKAGHITGHEQIAGFRGKCDPGLQFDWARVMGDLNLSLQPEHLHFACQPEDLTFAREFLAQNPHAEGQTWSILSASLEQRIKSRSL